MALEIALPAHREAVKKPDKTLNADNQAVAKCPTGYLSHLGQGGTP